ncbi:MAG: Cna B-type domain-containing protein, partial [Erysipelotrichaceae bacterium]|nr:Cna B-type domain-containing protein [Erysipelotrichaceae bacterium]
LTNTHVPELTDRTVIKVWDDKDNQDGKRPTTLAVLFTGGTTTEKVVLSESNDWTYTIKNLPVYENGKKIDYKWVEASIDGYSLTTDVDGTGKITTLTNHYTPGKTSATIEKIWDDKDDQDGVRPEELKVDLLADGKVVKTVTLNEANGWTATVADLDKMAAGKEIKYTWSEKDLSSDYTLGGTSTEGFITSITNVHVPEETERTVKKVWNDNNNQDGKRPANLNVVLMADGEVYKSVVLNADNNWSYTAEKLPVYAAGKQITYTWAEDEDGLPEGYELTDTKTSGKITTFTNSYKPEETDRTVVKVWNDNENQDGKRPVSLDVALKADGKVVKTVTLNADNEWSATVNKLPVYADGKQITYTWSEDEESIAPTYELTDVAVSEDGKVTTLTNTHKPEETEAIVLKVWNDGSNQDGKRPTELTVNLLANGEIIQTVVLKAEEWTTTISKLPVYAAGKKIAYTWTEDEAGLPEGYVLISNETNGKITTITNGHTPENTYATVKKVWDDANDQDHKRPEELKVDLKADGAVVATVTLNADNKWKATVEDLPVYSNGKVIEYTWVEDELPEGYVLSDTSVDGKITTLTNSYKPEETEATVKKVWEDKNNQDGKRPASLEVVLKADGVKKTTVTLNADNDWSATVKDLPVYDDGNAIVYTWAENEAGLPEGYELTDTSINGTVTTLTNTYKPEETSATVIKAWADKDNQDGKRPAELKVVLKGNDKEIKTVTLTADTNWTAKVDELPMYENGKKIDYTWAEDEAGLPEGYELDGSTKDGTVTTITNKYTPEETERTVLKVWDDAENQDGKRP